MAPLKPKIRRCKEAEELNLHALTSVAPLKHDGPEEIQAALNTSPRSHERGPVEAGHKELAATVLGISPRSHERGPVEAASAA